MLFSLALGVFLIWIIYKDLTEEDKAHIIESFSEANYWWIGASSVVAIFSHIFRAYRWKYPLESLNIKIDLPNRFAAVMIGYLANLAFPRLGEVSRCAVLARYQKKPFEVLFGTVLAERLVDMLLLIAFIFLAIILQFNILRDFLDESFGSILNNSSSLWILGVTGLFGCAVVYVLWTYIQRSEIPVFARVRKILRGLFEGFATLKTMDGQLGFYFHTALIWGCYILMFMLTFQAFPETSSVPFGGMLAAFVLGGISIVAVQGGLGAYPLAIMIILVLYGVPETRGYAFGWIVWSAQTAMIILVGFLSILVMPLLNPSTQNEEASA